MFVGKAAASPREKAGGGAGWQGEDGSVRTSNEIVFLTGGCALPSRYRVLICATAFLFN